MTDLSPGRAGAAAPSSPARWPLRFAVAVVALGLPHVGINDYQLHVGIFALFVVGIGIAYDSFVGATGYRSFAHAAFLAVSAYATAILSTHGVDVRLAWLAGTVASAITALAIGAVALRRVRGFVFSIVTLGFGVIVYVVANAWVDVTRGPQGIYQIPSLSIGTFGLNSLTRYYYAALLLAVLVHFVSLFWLRGARGRRLLAIRENEDLAEACGLNAYLAKLGAFVFSAALMGVMGGFYAQYYTIVTPDLAWLQWIMLLMAIVVVAGPGHRVGVICASLFLVIGPEILRAGQSFRELLSGILMLVTVLVSPEGWTPTIKRYVARRRAASR